MSLPNITPEDIFPPDILQDILPGRRASAAPRNRNKSKGLNTDTFQLFGGRVPTLKDLPSGGALAGVKQILEMVRATFLGTASNSSAMFRFGLADWAIGMLAGAAAEIQKILTNAAFKDTPIANIAMGLKAVVDTLTGLIKGFADGHKNTLQGDKQLGKMMSDIGKPAG